MGKFCKLDPAGLKVLRQVGPYLMSYNVEMTEVTGGTFWKAYTPGQINGTETFAGVEELGADMINTKELMQYYPPIELASPRFRKLAKALGTAWVRVSGSWSTKTYYDFDGHTNGKIPDGYQNVLTRERWIALLDFVKHIGGKLMISLANCEGLHSAHEPWEPSQAEQIFALSKEYGVPIQAVETANEPNPLRESGFPIGYTAADFVRDQDLLCKWVRANYPDTIIVGPSTISGEYGMGPSKALWNMDIIPTEQLLEDAQEPLDIFSYHFYNGVSERFASILPGGHWLPEQALSEAYLDAAPACAKRYLSKRDRFVPGAPIWVTEAGDSCGGGSTWASTYLDVPRTLNELASFATLTDGVVFHNTLASSDYGFLHHTSFEPRPNYFAALLWNRLMGTTVYDAGPVSEGAHIYAHSRRDGKDGVTYLIINNSETDTTTVELPKDAQRYTLAGKDGNKRATVMTLNGTDLVLGDGDSLPAMEPVCESAGKIELAPMTCTFLVL